MKIPAHFDAAVGLESISVKGPESTQSFPERSFVGNKEAVSLALTNTFPTFQLQIWLMNSFLPDLAAKGLFKDHIRKLRDRFSQEEDLKETELFALLQEDFERHEKAMLERQKHVEP